MRYFSFTLISFVALAVGVPETDAQPGGFGGGRRSGGRQPSPIMAALDANEDGKLSAEEIKNAPAALRTLDKNGDGKLSGDEIRPARRGGQFGGRGGGFDPGQLVDRILQNDTDGDGKLSAEEIPDRMKARLEEVDTNGDGAVDKAEVEAMVKALAERFGGGGPGGRGARESGRPKRPETEE